MSEFRLREAWVVPGYLRLCHGSGAVMEALSGDTGTRLFVFMLVVGSCVAWRGGVEDAVVMGVRAWEITELGTFAHETRRETDL